MGAPIEMTKNINTQNLGAGFEHLEHQTIESHHTKSTLAETTDVVTAKPIHLSNRQQQMLDSIVKGLRYKEIAFEYGISENTVAFHISKLKERLNCASSREIISSAILNGLVSLDKK